MARRKKDGRRATGVQSKKGLLYIVTTQNAIKNGERVNEKKWTSTGLADTPENVKKASAIRMTMLSGNKTALIDRDITVSDYVDRFLERKKRTVSDTTYSGYYHRGTHIKTFFASIRVNDVKTRDVEQFLDYLFTERGIQPRSVKDIKVLFGTILDLAAKDGLISVNPAREAVINKNLSAKYAKAKKEDDDFFSYREAQQFLEIVENHPLYELFFVTLFFGLRREEVLGLRWSSVNFAEKRFVINHTVTKGTGVNRLNATKTTSSTRTYPLNDEQVRMFAHLREVEKQNRRLFGNGYQDNDYIFKHEDGKPYYPDYPTKAFGKVIKAHPELPQGITFHGLRSSCVSILVHEGFDVKRIQKWVGHADIETTLKIYAKVKDKEAKQEILNGMNDIIKPKSYELETAVR